MKKILAVFVCGLVLGGLIGWFVHQESSSTIVGALRQSDLNSDTSYEFIDPLLGLKNSDTEVPGDYLLLQHIIQVLIDTKIQDDELRVASVNFRTLGHSEGFTVNAEEQYSPASLFKVPIMMTFLKMAEDNPILLSQTLFYDEKKDLSLQEYTISPVQLTKGRSYKISELIERMIRYSDNNATALLTTYLTNQHKADALLTMFKDLGISRADLTSDHITINAYALFFRVLYNATYLNRTMSERALALLSQTDYSKGLDAGVPNSIKVAQKFGEYIIISGQNEILERELHNCGIIYYPGHPYLLCVMTKGKDFSKLQDIIEDISRAVFEFKNKKYSVY